MTYRPIASDIEEYDDESMGADVGFYDYVPQQRTPPSARRQTVERPVAPATSRLQSARQPASPTRPVRTTIDVVRNGDEMYYESTHARPRRSPATRDDPRVTTNLKPAQQPRRIGRRTLFVGGASLVIACIVGTEVVSDKMRTLSLLMAQGPEPYKNLALYCGHAEKPGSPTLLHIFVMDYHLTVIEFPGGNLFKPHETVLDGLPVTGDVSQWDLQVVKQQVDGGKWQIQLSIQGPGFIIHWLLVDSGQGYFRAVNPK